MLWIIISIMLLLLGLYLLIFGDSDGEHSIGSIPIVFGSIVLGIFMFCRVEWYQDYEEYKIINVSIENDITTIKQMRKTYYEPPKNIQFNMDLVNKELSKQINDKVIELNYKVNEYNNNIKKWNVSYRYKFWNACPVKLKEDEFKILKLSDYEL